MKITDLISGAWVIRKGCPEEPMRVVNWNPNSRTILLDLNGFGVTMEIEDLEPIPLTYELLESNFGESEHKLNIDPQYMKYVQHKNFYIGVQLRPSPDCRKQLSIYNYITRRSIEYRCDRPDDVEKPLYVHELQKALYLCDIDDDIIVEPKI